MPLDTVGRAQARRAAPLVAALRPARLWSSDLARARQTAEQLAEACGLLVEEDPRLREFSVGDRQGLTWAEAIERFPWIARGVGLGERLAGVPGAETDADVAARVVPAVEECLARSRRGRPASSSATAPRLKIALGGLLGWDEAVVRTLSVLDNCHWATVLAPAVGDAAGCWSYGVGDFASPPAIG